MMCVSQPVLNDLFKLNDLFRIILDKLSIGLNTKRVLLIATNKIIILTAKNEHS